MGFLKKLFSKKEKSEQQQEASTNEENEKFRPAEKFAEGMFHDKNQPDENLGDLLGKGAVQMQVGNYEQALYFFNKALKIDPNYSAAYNNKGNTLRTMGQLDEALDNYNKAIEIHPKEPEYYYNKASVLEEMENFDDAKAAYLKTLDLRNDHIEALNALALCYVRNKDYENTHKYLDRLLKISPNDLDGLTNMINVLYELKRDDEADELYNQALKKYPDDKSLISTKPHYLSINEGVNSAERIFDDYYNETKNIEIIKYKADFLFSKDPKKSLAAYDQYLIHQPKDGHALYYSSVLFEQIGDYENQLKKLNELLDSYENDYNALFSKALTLHRLKRSEESINVAQKLLSLYPDQHDIMNNLPLLLREGFTKEKAFTIMDKFADDFPENRYNLIYRKGLMYIGYEDYDKAIDIFNELNEEYNFAWNYYQIAIINNIKGDIETCLQNLEKTFALDPSLIEDAKNFEGLNNLKDDAEFNNLLNKMEVRKVKNDIGVEIAQIHYGTQGENIRALLGQDSFNDNLLLDVLSITKGLGPILEKGDVKIYEFDLKELGETTEKLKVGGIEHDKFFTAFPMLETERTVAFETKKINEWAHFGKIEAEIYGNVFQTFGLGFFAKDYSFNKEKYHSHENVEIKISAFALSVDEGYDKKYWGDNLDNNFSGYLPDTAKKNNCYYNFVTNVIEYEKVQIIGNYGYIIKVELAKDETENFFIDMFINAENMGFDALRIGMQISGTLWFQGELL